MIRHARVPARRRPCSRTVMPTTRSAAVPPRAFFSVNRFLCRAICTLLVSAAAESIGGTTTAFTIRPLLPTQAARTTAASRLPALVAARAGSQPPSNRRPCSLSLTLPLRSKNGVLASVARMMSSSIDGADVATGAAASAAAVAADRDHGPFSSLVPLPPSLSNKIVGTLDPCVVLMKRMVQEHSDKWKDRGGIYALSQGVVYWTPPHESVSDMQSALLSENSNLHMYGPDEGLTELREALEAKVARENRLANHDVMVTVGANQAYVNCVLTLLDGEATPSRDDSAKEPAIERAVVFAPYYFNHVMAIQMCSPESLLVGPCSDDGVPDADWLEQQFRSGQNIQMVTVVNPGNPTGVALDRSILQRVVDLCRTYSCWLVLDCTYENFVHSTGTVESTVNGNNGSGPRFDGCFDDEPHVIHIFSFSKSYALAGYRCGYLALHRGAAGLYENMLKVQDTVPIAPSRIAQVAALGALRAGETWVADRVATLAAGREAILNALRPLKVMGGTGAMYVMAQLPESYRSHDQTVARDLVRDYGVAVIPGSFCGFPGWIRVCYSNLPPDLCLQAADRLSKGIQSLIDSRIDVE